MNVKKTVVVALSMAVLGAASASSARADESNKLTYLTFSQDVAIPGKVLPAGTYTFRLVDSPSERHIVQIFNQTGTQLIATLLTVADQRRDIRQISALLRRSPRCIRHPAALRFG